MNVDWLDDDGAEFNSAQKAAVVLQAACEKLSPEGIPDGLPERLHLLFAAAVQVSSFTSAWANQAAQGGIPKEAVAEAANRALNSLTQAAACVAMAMVEESHACAAPKFSDN